MKFKDWLIINEVAQVGYDVIQQKQLFGPVYHGTTQEKIDQILNTGFKVHIGTARTGDVTNGFPLVQWNGGNVPPPVHFLGYGIYFTQSKNSAKMYNQNTAKGLKQFYLDVPNLETINFASPRKMMEWWMSNGYNMKEVPNLQDYTTKLLWQSPHKEITNFDGQNFNQIKFEKQMQQIEALRIQATKNMTEVLKSKFDAVLFTAKTMRGSLLDGNQICVFDPQKIYMFNPELNPETAYLTGDRIKIKGLNIAIKINGSRPSGGSFEEPWELMMNQKIENYLSVELSESQAESIKQIYFEKLKNTILQNMDKGWIKLRWSNTQSNKLEETPETFAVNYANYLTSKNALRLNFPDLLVERKLKPKERLGK